MQISSGRPLAIVCLKGSVFTIKYIFQVSFWVSFGEGVFVSLRDITYMKIPDPWEHVCLYETRESVDEGMQGQVEWILTGFSVAVVISSLKEKMYF